MRWGKFEIIPSLHRRNVWYLFRDTGQEIEISVTKRGAIKSNRTLFQEEIDIFKEYYLH